MKAAVLFAAIFAVCSARTAYAESFNLICDVAGDLRQQQFILQISEPTIPFVQSPTVSLVDPNYGKMSLYEMNNLRLAAHIHHPVPGSPDADLAIIINRNTGGASLYLLKSPRPATLDVFWFRTDELLGK